MTHIKTTGVLRRGGILLALGAAAMSSCTDTTTSTSALPATISLSVAPNPISATPSSDAAYDWTAALILTVSETAGTGLNISTISATINESAGGILIESGEDEVFRVNVAADGARIEPNETRTISVSIDYALPGGGREAVIGVIVATIDDVGFADQEAVTADVQ